MSTACIMAIQGEYSVYIICVEGSIIRLIKKAMFEQEIGNSYL